MNKTRLISWTTNGSGAATVTSSEHVFGRLYAIEYRPEATTNATFVVTCEADTSKPLFTKATAGGSTAWFYPRDLVHDVADGSALTGTLGGDRELPVLNGYPKVVISSGGATKAGSLILFYEE